jgi:transcriptional regulator with XRE-family HTH domain
MITPKGREFLTKYNTTTTQIARATRISKSMIQRALAGTRCISMEKAARIASYLGITLDEAMDALYDPAINPVGYQREVERKARSAKFRRQL